MLALLYQLAGDLDGALKAYDRYANEYPDDVGDPHHTFCWGLALFQDDRRKDALQRWREAIFQNVYVAPLLLDRALPDPDIWHGTNLAMPDYAARYVNLFGELWEDTHDARTALTYLWSTPRCRTPSTDGSTSAATWPALSPRTRSTRRRSGNGDSSYNNAAQSGMRRSATPRYGGS